jgi:hypothetical protein
MDVPLQQGNNDNLTLLLLTLFHIHVLSGVQLEGNKHNLLKEVRPSLQHDVQEEPMATAACKLYKDKG